MYGDPAEELSFITYPINGAAATGANGGTIMFKAPSVEAAKLWHAVWRGSVTAAFRQTERSI